MRNIWSPAVLSVLVLIVFGFSSCASMLNGSHQDVTFILDSEETALSIDGDSNVKGLEVVKNLYRDMRYRQVEVSHPDHLDTYYALTQYKRPFSYVFSWFPFGIVMAPLYDDNRNAWDYEGEISRFRRGPLLVKREEHQKNLKVNKAAFDVDESQTVIRTNDYKGYVQNSTPIRTQSPESEIKMPNSVYKKKMDGLLKKTGFSDSTDALLSSKSNSMLLDFTVSELHLDEVKVQVLQDPFFGATYESHPYYDPLKFKGMFYRVYLKVNFQIMDAYEQTVFDSTVTCKSGEYVKSYWKRQNKLNEGSDKKIDALNMAVEDGLKKAFLKFADTDGFRNAMLFQEDEEEDYELLTLNRSENKGNSVDQAIQAAYTVKIGERGHGSGFAVSDEGHIVTNYHVVAGVEEDSLFVLVENEEVKAEVVRVSREADLALIKIDKPTPVSLTIPETENHKMGITVFAIGTPSNIQLGQTLSKGIISGVRQNDGIKYIQTDVSINRGNSGGPLIDENGNLLGVVTSKLLGYGVEGIGFVVPAHQIKNQLNIHN